MILNVTNNSSPKTLSEIQYLIFGDNRFPTQGLVFDMLYFFEEQTLFRTPFRFSCLSPPLLIPPNCFCSDYLAPRNVIFLTTVMMMMMMIYDCHGCSQVPGGTQEDRTVINHLAVMGGLSISSTSTDYSRALPPSQKVLYQCLSSRSPRGTR